MVRNAGRLLERLRAADGGKARYAAWAALVLSALANALLAAAIVLLVLYLTRV